MPQQSNRYTVPALEKGLTIIEMLVDSQEPLGISEITNMCNLPKSSVFMIMATLEDHHYVEKNDEGKYRLALKLYSLGMASLLKVDVREVARPFMEKLAQETGYTVHLATLAGGKAVYIDKVNGPGFVQFATSVGQSWHLHLSGVGKALAAHLSEEQIDKIIKEHGLPTSTQNSLNSAESFKEFLNIVRETGFAIEDEEGEIGIRCIAAPIFDHTKRVVAAISITSLRNELPSVRFQEVGQMVKEKALSISQRLGFPTD